MKERIIRFLNAMNTSLEPVANGERLDLYHIGRSALVWKHGFLSATQDVDVVAPVYGERLMKVALDLFGVGTPKAKEYGLYLEEVPPGLPPVWHGCFNRASQANEQWSVIRLYHFEDHDLAVTKMKRFYVRDQEDIRQMCDLGLIDPDTLMVRMDAAYPYRTHKDGDEDWRKAYQHAKVVTDYLESGDWRPT